MTNWTLNHKPKNGPIITLADLRKVVADAMRLDLDDASTVHAPRGTKGFTGGLKEIEIRPPKSKNQGSISNG